ncbi:cysteine hydrolase family protein [Salinicola endophyticus]|uniref:Cysteine hydrolase family protein n=1 Tax=Salinicola endophyticus TaxID=1949083 RepID=A0AB74UCZ5_9GAMM
MQETDTPASGAAPGVDGAGPARPPAESALILIDQQHCMQALGTEQRNNHDAEALIAALLGVWRQRQWPVVHVRHISRSETSGFRPGQSGAAFQEAFMPLAHEAVFEKNVPDAFTQSALERWLHVRGIRHLMIVGVASENSVENSARSAGNLGFTVWVPEAACYTFAKPDYAGVWHSASEVHAMAMANLDGEYANVVDRAWLLAALEGWQAE